MSTQSISHANKLFREKKYKEALEAYKKVHQDIPALRSTVSYNIGLINSKLNSHPTVSSNFKELSELPSVIFLLPVGGTGGGVHSVFQEACAMSKLGIKAKIAVKEEAKSVFINAYGKAKNQEEDIFVFYKGEEDLISISKNFNVAVATIYHSVKTLKKIVDTNPEILPAYYIQDYEPWFFKLGSKGWKEAFLSYNLIENCVLFAKTHWIIDKVYDYHGKIVNKVYPSIDNSVYFCNEIRLKNESDAIKISAMIRPQTPRRGADRTMDALKKIKQKYREKVSIIIFGCAEDNKNFQELSSKDFEYINKGELKREEVANTLREADLFVDFSDYQAFGRTALEAMACGCAVVVPQEGGADEFAVHDFNCLIVNTKKTSECYDAIDQLVSNPGIRNSIILNAIATAAEYNVNKAAISEINIFHRELLAKRNLNSFRPKPGAINTVSLQKTQPSLLDNDTKEDIEIIHETVSDFGEDYRSLLSHIPKPELSSDIFGGSCLSNGVSRSAWIPDYWINESYESKIKVSLLKNAKVYGGRIRGTEKGFHSNGQFVKTNNNLLHSASFGVWNGEQLLPKDIVLKNSSGLLSIKPDPKLHYDGLYYLIGNVQNQFGHVILEGLSRLWALNDEFLKNKDVKFLIYEESIPEYAKELLSLAGVDLKKIIFLPSEGAVVKNIFIPSPAMRTHRWVSSKMKNVWDTIRTNALDDNHKKYSKVYLSRSRFLERKLENELEVEETFKKLGYEIIYPEKMTLKEQINAVANADSIAGPTGSQMYLACFQKDGGKNITLAPANFYTKDDFLIGKVKNHKTDVIFGSQIDHDLPRINRGWNISLEDINILFNK